MLRAAMDFFDTENDRRGGVVAGDSSSIDYRHSAIDFVKSFWVWALGSRLRAPRQERDGDA